MAERVLVCGGRDFQAADYLFDVLDIEHQTRGVEVIIHGAAKGADTLAGQWAVSRGVPFVAYPADWERFKNAAGPIRNSEMLREGRPTLVVAFAGGKGTAHMVALAKRAKVTVLDLRRFTTRTNSHSR